MASKAYEGNFVAKLLSTEPAAWKEDEASPTITQTEWDGGTLLLRLVSDGGITYQYNQATASQAKVDDGKVSHAIGTREITGLDLVHEIDFPLDTDAMWNEYNYGDTRWLVVSTDGEPTTTGHVLHVFQIETGEKQTTAPARDTIQNMRVSAAVNDWNLDVPFTTP